MRSTGASCALNDRRRIDGSRSEGGRNHSRAPLPCRTKHQGPRLIRCQIKSLYGGLRLSQCFQAVLFNDGKELERHAARTLRASLPFLNRGSAGVEVARKDRLADTKTLAQLSDLLWLKRWRSGKTRSIETAHGRLVNRAHLEHRRGRGVDRLECVALEFRLGCHLQIV